MLVNGAGDLTRGEDLVVMVIKNGEVSIRLSQKAVPVSVGHECIVERDTHAKGLASDSLVSVEEKLLDAIHIKGSSQGLVKKLNRGYNVRVFGSSVLLT